MFEGESSDVSDDSNDAEDGTDLDSIVDDVMTKLIPHIIKVEKMSRHVFEFILQL